MSCLAEGLCVHFFLQLNAFYLLRRSLKLSTLSSTFLIHMKSIFFFSKRILIERNEISEMLKLTKNPHDVKAYL